MTLAELVLALAVTAFIGASIATMIYASSISISDQKATRSLAVANDVCAVRIDGALRNSSRLLADGNYFLVLWTGDPDGNSAPVLSELQLIDFDPNTGDLWSFKAPSNLSASSNTSYPLGTTNFASTTSSLMNTSNFPGTLWGTGITAWNVVTMQADPNLVRYVGYQLSITCNGATQTTASGAGLRNH